jgi:GH24 family phage-related lysozyme (muramidase)
MASSTQESLLNKLGLNTNKDIVDALKRIQVGDKDLLKRVVQGQKLSAKDNQSLKEEMVKVNKNLELLTSTVFKTEQEPSEVQILGANGKPIDMAQQQEDVKITFKELVSKFDKQIQADETNDSQTRFLLEQIIEVGEKNSVSGESFDELKTILSDQNNIIRKEDDILRNILLRLRDESEAKETNLNLDTIEELIEQANFINDKIADGLEKSNGSGKESLIDKASKKFESAAGTIGDAVGGLLGIPGLGEIAGSKIGGKLAKFGGPALLGVAIGAAIGEFLINPIFDKINEERRKATAKKLGQLEENTNLLGGRSESDTQSARNNLQIIDQAASQGLFGERRKQGLTGLEAQPALIAFNKKIEEGGSQQQALRAALTALNEKEAEKLKKSGGGRFGSAGKIQATQGNDLANFDNSVGNFTAQNQVSSFQGGAAVARGQVLDGISSSGAIAGQSTNATAKSVGSKLGFAVPGGAETGDLVVDLLKSMEGFESMARPDPVGIPTIGYGHALQSKEELARWKGKTISEAEATQLLRKDIKEHQAGAIKGLKVPVSSEQMAAMTLFAFNLGKDSSGLKKIVQLTNEGKTEEAANKFLLYTKATNKKGKKVELGGLVKRRGLESGLFLAGAKALNQPSPGVSAPSVSGLALSPSSSPTVRSSGASAPSPEPESSAIRSLTPARVAASSASPRQLQRAQNSSSASSGGGSQSVSRPGPGRKTEVQSLKLAILNNGMLDT